MVVVFGINIQCEFRNSAFRCAAVVLSLLIFSVHIAAQVSYYQSPIQKVPRAAQINARSIRSDFGTRVMNLEAPAPDGKSYNSYLQQLKKNIIRQPFAPQSSHKSTAAALPTLLFEADGVFDTGSTPNDNDIAVSKDNWVVYVINSKISMFNTDSTDAEPVTVSLEGFTAALTDISASRYDPKIIYDPAADRFIFICLAGYDSQNTHAIVGFSLTNDPTADWNLFALSGNPHNDSTWSDFPMIALTEKELFLTLNLLQDGETWQEGFRGTIIWQILKDSGLQTELTTVFYDDIKYNDNFIRNLCPVKGGSRLYDPNMYFLSNRNFAEQNDTVFLVEIDDWFLSNPQMHIQALVSDTPYRVPPDALQPNNQKLSTNDARILGAFYENDAIQFVANSSNENGQAAVYHGIINNVSGTPSVSGTIISDTLDFGYPNLAYVGSGEAGDERSIILLNYAAANTYAGMGAMYFDGMNYSELLQLKKGNKTIDIINGADRWGDYSGAQRDYSNGDRAWLAGTYGKNVPFGPGSISESGTWIAQVESPPYENTAAIIPTIPPTTISLFPNPAHFSDITLDFEINAAQILRIALYDMQGNIVKILLQDKIKKGKNRLTFSPQSLVSGTYILHLSDMQGNTVISHQVIVQ